MLKKTDEQLVAKATKGCRSAWFELVKRYEKAIYNYGLRMMQYHEDDAMDLMQEVFISAFRSLDNYRGEGTFRAWLFRIANYRCIELYRRKRWHECVDDLPEPHCEHSPPERLHRSAQNQQLLVKAMMCLPMTQRIVIELKFFEQFTFDEIAEQLGVSGNTIKSRLYSALDKMKVYMEPYDVDT